MPIPILIVGVFILISLIGAANRRKAAQEQQKRFTEQRQADPAAKIDSEADARRAQAGEPKAAGQRAARPVKAPVAASERTAERPASVRVVPPSQTAEREKGKSMPKTAPETAKAAGPLSGWNTNAALQGIVYAEVLGKPKALRQKKH